MKPNELLPPCAMAVALLLPCAAFGAQPVTITNPSFEDPVLNDGALSAVVPGWTAFNGGDIEVLNPSATFDLTGEAPAGANVALVTSTSAEDGLAQVLARTLQNEDNLVLTVKIANTRFTESFPGYRVQLVANGTVLAEDNNSQSIAEDAVVTSTVNYLFNAGAHAALVGQPLEIRLLSKGLVVEQEIAFDDVQLTATLNSPVADAGGPYVVSYNGPLLLDGGGSLPSDGQSIVSYEWDLDNDGDYDEAVSGATPASIPYATLLAAPPTGYGMVTGPNTIRLRVTDSSTPTPKVSTATTTVMVGSSMVVYEPFADPDPLLNGNSAGSGLTGNWTAHAAWAVDPGSVVWGALQTSGNLVRATTGGGAGASVSVPTGTLAGSGLLDHGATLWFSMVYTTTPGATSLNPDAGFALGSAALGGGNNIPMNSSGNGIGFSVKSGQLHATTWTGGVLGRAAASASTSEPIGNSATYFVVGEIIWGADATAADTINLYFPNRALELGPVVATRSAVLDQSAFNVISYNHKNDSTPSFVDEIRFGVAYSDVAPAETGPLTLAPADIVDNKSGGPVLESDTLVYTVSFNKAVVPSSVSADDFENGGTAPLTINSVAVSGKQAIVTVTPTFPGAAGTLQLRVKAGAVIEDYLGNALDTTAAIADDTVITVNADTVVPTVVSIASPPAASPIYGLPTIPYIVTFDKYFMDDATVTASDFSNAGTAAITVGTVTRISTGTAPAAYRVEVTPTGAGTIQLQLSGTVSDLMGNSVVTPLDDEVVYTIGGAEPARETITFDGFVSALGVLNQNPFILNYNASASDKLVVVATGEHNFGGNLSGDIVSIKYDGVELTKAVEISPAAWNSGGHGQTAHDIWYLDNPGAVHTAGVITINIIGNGANYVYTAIGLSGTAPGTGITAGVSRSASLQLIPSSLSSLVISSIGMGGNGNTATPLPGVSATSPAGATTFTGLENGNNWAGHAVARSFAIPVTTQTFTFGTAALDVATIAVEFQAAIIQSSAGYAGWAQGPFAGSLSDPNPSLDFDGGGLETGIEWVVGGDPTNGSDDAGKAPTFSNSDPNNFVFTFRRRDAAEADPKTAIAVQYSTNLVGWTAAANGVSGVTIDDSAVPEPGFRTVVVSIPKALAGGGGRLFARLNVVVTP